MDKILITRSRNRTKVAIASALFVLAVVSATGMTSPEKSSPPLEHDAYIWQRAWRAPLVESIAANKDVVRAWRVLAAQASPAGKLLPVSIQAKAITDSGRPLIMVVRIDGQLPNFDQVRLLDEVLALHQRWHDQGLTISGMEIDHDCGTAKLPGYAKFLSQLRSRLDRGTQLSITVLPAWLSSSQLAEVLGIVDESVLQVHSLQNPGDGLFDPVQAAKWVKNFSKVSPTPYRVALPTYGSRVGFDDSGRVDFVESETALGRGGKEARELIVAPESVRRLLLTMENDRPTKMLGYAWFRLPTDADQRAWSVATWRAIVQGTPLTKTVRLLAKPSADPRLFDLVAQNDGPTDVSPPTHIRLASDCTDADGVSGYGVQTIDGRFWLVRDATSLLHPRHELNLGWARCCHNPSKELNESS